MPHLCPRAVCVPAVAALLLAACSAPSHSLQPHAESHQVNCLPADGREGQVGCWIRASAPVSTPAGVPLYWHIYEFASPEQARQAENPQSRVVEAYDRTWLLAVASQDWRVEGGRHAASVGPLRLLSSASHTASFMEATFTPGMRSRVHTHPGPEGWLVLEGEQCLETPEGAIRVGAGESMMVRGGIPMVLYGTGTGIRRALVVIVHPTGEPLGTTHGEWQPSGSCLAG